MGFAKAAQAAGVVIERGVEVTGIETAGGRVAGVVTTEGRIATPRRRERGRALRAGDRPHGRRGRARRRRTAATSSSHRRPSAAAWQVPASRIMVIDFETTFYFHREGAGLLFGMGDPAEPSTFDTTVRWDFLTR